MKPKNETARRVFKLLVGMAIVSSATLATAAPPRDGATGQRDVIGDAVSVCWGWSWPGVDGIRKSACDLLNNTNGDLDANNLNCVRTKDDIVVFGTAYDPHVVTYRLRNCERNEEALLRLSASAILSIEDYLDRSKDEQRQTAADYLCAYKSKYENLVDAGKLTSTKNLAEDAENIVINDLSLTCL